ncbi:hypothetical protein [Brachyspira sp. SAP_772]|uniref:hypothetical protein n=1 Tax=Brachyspira sp. SAP_772 TaxID=2608385 RepID=UPI0012F51A0E|nr:hypothetical protein [Brachyspira sp. SAP_772]
MKKIILIIISLFTISCLDDINTIKKESLFSFYTDMKNEIINENINWIEKNSNMENISSLEDIILNNNDSIKNMLSLEDGEYSATINYITAEANQNDRGSYIIRNTKLSPTYYYITLVYESSKWKIETIDKLPLNN